MGALKEWLSGYQFVWWGWRACADPPLVAWSRLTHERDGLLSAVYTWTMVIGPLEIRRWNPELREGQ
jgi:hypothetical protein